MRTAGVGSSSAVAGMEGAVSGRGVAGSPAVGTTPGITAATCGIRAAVRCRCTAVASPPGLPRVPPATGRWPSVGSSIAPHLDRRAVAALLAGHPHIDPPDHAAGVHPPRREAYLIPAIGRLRLTEVTTRHLTAMFADLAAAPTPTGRPETLATLQRITDLSSYTAAVKRSTRPQCLHNGPASIQPPPSAERPT
jgi:hypothetical protein